MKEAPLNDVAVLLRPEDEVAVLKVNLQEGSHVIVDGDSIRVRTEIGAGHKLALHRVRRDEPVRKYGQIIGYAREDIEAGDWVHTHNLALAPSKGTDRETRGHGDAGKRITEGNGTSLQSGGSAHAQGGLQVDYAFCADAKPVEYYSSDRMRTFMGYKRPDGRVGTRNYVALVSTVNCSATTTQMICDAFRDRLNLRTGKRTRNARMKEFANVDGIIPITHKNG